jgi:hypothetical protein
MRVGAKLGHSTVRVAGRIDDECYSYATTPRQRVCKARVPPPFFGQTRHVQGRSFSHFCTDGCVLRH